MESEINPDITPTTAQFAKPEAPNRNDLKWRIMACLGERLPDLHDVHVTVFGGTVTIRAKLRSVQEKRLCLECCRHVPGVMRVVDDLVVAT